MGMDILTAGVGFFSFGIFLVVHIITFRWVRPEHLLRSLLACVVIILACPLVMMGIFFAFKAVDFSVYVWVFAALLAMLVHGLLCFVYVLCVFGPYETSIRMRLVREIATSGADGISLQELLGRYNFETIVNVRLQRLIGSGDIIEINGRYRAGSGRNFFFIFNAVGEAIKKWISR